MRKLPSEIDGPVDNIILDFVEKTTPYLHYNFVTPNLLTTISTLFGLGSMYYFYHNKSIIAGILFFLFYLFDCYDGYYARKYNMVTKFGDYYDHLKDGIIIILVFYIAYMKKNNLESPYFAIILIIGIILYLLSVSHLGCTEIYYDNHEDGETMILHKMMCPTDNKEETYKFLREIRYFSTGTVILYFILVMNILVSKDI